MKDEAIFRFQVSYKIGDSVPLTTVYSKQQVDSTTSCEGKGGSTCTNGIISSNPSLRNYFMPDGNQDQHLACKVDKFVSVSDKSCSPIAGAGRASPFLGPGSTGKISNASWLPLVFPFCLAVHCSYWLPSCLLAVLLPVFASTVISSLI